jgi:heptosyltransferase-2
MITSPPNPKPVRLGRYRYSKLRWRMLVHVLDFVGTIVFGIVRFMRRPCAAGTPRRILIVQLDHLGDAVLSTPLIADLRAAYPESVIDVLASPSNHEVFKADPHVNRVLVAERTWFERRPERWALAAAVWDLGRFLRPYRYDLGIDVRGDVLSVLVLTLAGVRRRVGWAMGGGAFALTDVTGWIPGRHEVRSRLALLSLLGIPRSQRPRVDVHVDDLDRIAIARRLAEAWPRRAARRHEVYAGIHRDGSLAAKREFRRSSSGSASHSLADDGDWLHADRFTRQPPLLAVHLGAGTSAKRWPIHSWRILIDRFLVAGWRVIIVGACEDIPLASSIPPHDHLRDWAGTLTVRQTTGLLERADLFIGADSGPAHLAASAGTLSVILFSGTNQPRQWRPWSRHSLILRHRVSCQPCHQKVCPLADHPCMSGIDPDRVYRAAMRWWSRTHRAESPHAPI